MKEDVKMAELSPMMKQYLRIKSQNEDSILFFRVGDFYEMFFDDAKKASDELDLTLTGKDCGMGERAPMCGVPYHSCESYIARLVQKGYKVAICEQTEDPKTAKKLVDRDIIRVITPGTVIEDMMLEEGKNNYLAAVALTGDGVGLCFTDASTGEEANTANLDAAVAAIEAVNPIANPRALDDFSVENELMLTMDNLVAYKGDVTNDQADCGLVFVAQAKDGQVDAVKSELEAYKASLSANDLYAEFADKIALAKDARIVTNGNYVAIVIAGIANPDYAAIDTALETALNF